ncbi:MAG: sulfatase-like hydrolase/transferase [Fimbriimonadaceae bacterium]
MDRPNLLLITTDQQRWDTIAALGARGYWTPHLDWLADTGVVFPDAITDCPVCGPARATIMTGQHAWRHGETSNRSTPSPMKDLPTRPGLLTAAGDQTRGVGKMHFHPTRAHYGFEHLEILPDYYRWIQRQPGARPPKNHGIGENEMTPCLATTDEHQTVSAWVADRAIDFLETRDETRPFFLWMSFSKPHPPFDPPLSCWEMIDPDEVADPLQGEWAADLDATAAWREPTFHLNNCHRFAPASRTVAGT